MSVDINCVKRKLFSTCNCILGNTKTVDEIVELSLMQSYCLPILMYATVAKKLSNEQINELNMGWNSTFRIFNFNKWESVRSFILGIGRLDFKHLRLYMCLKFYKLSLLSENRILHIMNMYCFSKAFQKLWLDALYILLKSFYISLLIG